MAGAVDNRHAQSNLRALRRCMQQHRDPRDAFRAFTGDSLSEMARRVGMARTDMNMMLMPQAVRRYVSDRRSFEAVYMLPPYSLDELLDRGEVNGKEQSAGAAAGSNAGNTSSSR